MKQAQEVILADVPESILQEIAGPYRIVGQELDLTVTVVDGHLKVEVPEAELVKFFHPTAENFFIDLSDGERIRIDRNEAGEVTAFQSLGGGTRVVRVKR